MCSVGPPLPGRRGHRGKQVQLSRLSFVVTLTALAVAVLACPEPPTLPTTGPEISCTNGADDNGDGLTDCQDPECASNVACKSVTVEEDAGPPCTVQASCDNSNLKNDRPPTQCIAQHCARPDAGITLELYMNLDGLGGGSPVKSANVRFVQNAEVSGSQVSCQTLLTVTKPDAGGVFTFDRIEESGRFNVLGYQVIGGNQSSGDLIDFFFPTGTGSNFLVVVETYGGSLSNQQPTGTLFSRNCFDTNQPDGGFVFITPSTIPVRALTPADQGRGARVFLR